MDLLKKIEVNDEPLAIWLANMLIEKRGDDKDGYELKK